MPMIMQENSFHRRAVCRKCEAVYAFDECLSSRTTLSHCKNKLFGKRCGQLLMKEVITSNGTTKYYPHKVHCFISLISYLQLLVMRSGFVQQCESTRNLFSESGLSDVYDGTLWNNFLSAENAPFLSECYNYGLFLNIDWLQPYKHIQYSVSVVYLVILNLPRSIRYKRQNVILFGVIPGPSEPSLSIDSYLLPLVRELQQLWNGVEMKLPGSVSTIHVRCALLGVACDLPAARKSCGFLSFSANLGCSRCYQQFSRGFGNRRNYSNFDRGHWELRTNSCHRSDVIKSVYHKN